MGSAIDGVSDREARLVSSDRLGVSIAFGGTYVVKLYYRMEEGTAPELEIGRYLEAKGLTGITPRVLGYVEYRVPRSEPVTLAIIEEYVVNEGTAWQHARSEIGRAYERVLAQPPGAAPPVPPVRVPARARVQGAVAGTGRAARRVPRLRR